MLGIDQLVAKKLNATVRMLFRSGVIADFASSHFVDQGVAVILGEYCVASRLSIPGFEESRIRWNKYVTEACIANFLVPVYWDAGYPEADNASGLFDRETGAQVHPDLINAIVGAVQ